MRHFGISEQTLLRNQMSVLDYFYRLCEMALACFNWKGLPETCDRRTIERSLLFTGKCLFFKDKSLDSYLTLPFNQRDKFDVYGNTVKRTAISEYTNYRYDCTNKDSVIIYNNPMRTSYTLNLMDFARRLYECDRTMDVNMKAQKTPVLITGKDKQMLALKNLYKKYDGNEPVIFADKYFESSAISCLKTEAPYLCDKIWNTKTNIWNEALTYLGVSNVTIEKRERLVTDEVERNQGGTILNCNIRLRERKEACEEINKMFGLNVSVEFNEGYGDMGEDTEVEDEMEVRIDE